MISIEQAIIVEGKYDKIKLGQIFDTVIVATNGFGIFNDSELLEYIRRLAKERGIIILTDADSGGLLIRNYIKSSVWDGRVYHAYIPEKSGKERRKAQPGREGLIGVEGIEDELIVKAVMSCGIDGSETKGRLRRITKTDMYELGLSGGENSSERRKVLARLMELPTNISSNALLDAINALYTFDELKALLNNSE